MANKFKGEAELAFTRTVDGEEKPAKFLLCFDANAFVELEGATKLTMMGLVEEVNDPAKMSMTLIRQMLWAGLLRHHPETTLRDAGDIMSDAGMEDTMAAFQKAMGGAFKAAAPVKKGAKTGEA